MDFFSNIRNKVESSSLELIPTLDTIVELDLLIRQYNLTYHTYVLSYECCVDVVWN